MDRTRWLWVIMCVVAAGQMGLVAATGLTRWKGGGLGMYSEAHPNERQVVLRDASGAPLLGAELATRCTDERKTYQRWPTAASARALADCAGPRARRVELWSPSVDPESAELGSRRVGAHDVDD